MFTDRANVLGKYRLIAEIAHGGMGIVYLAMAQGPRGFHKLVVVKELKPELVDEPTFLTMFLDEARLAARLSHPNIVQTNEVGSDGERYFMAMEYLDGRGLDHVRRRSKTTGFGLSSAMHIRIIADMLAGLDYAHQLTDFDGTPLQIVHRDVSPQNVFVTFSGHVKLLDFGIAKSAASPHQTSAGVLKGKVSYMSPEQARGLKVDARADVFSAGVMLWEALTGRRLRGDKNDRETLSARITAELPRASSVRPGIPHELDEICARALARDREERYQSAGHFQEDLERYLAAAAPTVTSRDVGECVSELFREDRVRTSALVEAHVAHARAGVASRDVPIIDVGARSTGSTPSERPGTSKSFTGSDAIDPTDPPSDPSGDIAVAAPSKPRLIGTRRTPYRRPVLVAGAVATATLAIVGLFTLLPRGDAPADARVERDPPAIASPAPMPVERAAPSPAAGTAPSEAPSRPSLVSVEIRVSPATARIEIDDAELTSNPFIGRYRADDVTHHVRASAPGYVTKTVAITFDANVRLDLSLERGARTPTASSGRSSKSGRPSTPAAVEAPGPAAPVTEPAPPPTPAPAPSKPTSPSGIDPAGGNRPQRPIDPTNPYSGPP
jgi:serine/threonine protein kinase